MAATDKAFLGDKQLAIAKVYARSLLALAEEGKSTEEVLEELGDLATLAKESPAFTRLISDPLLGSEELRGTLEKLFRGKITDLVVDTLQVMRRKGRLALLPALAESYRREHQAKKGILDVSVVSAVPLSADLRQRLIQAIDRHTARKSHLIETVDPEILGGLVVKVGDEKIDASVARELALLGRAFAARASKEILSGKAYTAEEAR